LSCLSTDGGYSAEFVRVPRDWIGPGPESLDVPSVRDERLGNGGFHGGAGDQCLMNTSLKPERSVASTGATGRGFGGGEILAKLGTIRGITQEEGDYLQCISGAKDVILAPFDREFRMIRSRRTSRPGLVPSTISGGDILAWLLSTMKSRRRERSRLASRQ
jgi:hypothetical protein